MLFNKNAQLEYCGKMLTSLEGQKRVAVVQCWVFREKFRHFNRLNWVSSTNCELPSATAHKESNRLTLAVLTFVSKQIPLIT